MHGSRSLGLSVYETAAGVGGGMRGMRKPDNTGKRGLGNEREHLAAQGILYMIHWSAEL